MSISIAGRRKKRNLLTLQFIKLGLSRVCSEAANGAKYNHSRVSVEMGESFSLHHTENLFRMQQRNCLKFFQRLQFREGAVFEPSEDKMFSNRRELKT